MTKAIRFHATGGPEVLRLEDVEIGVPGPGEVRIRNDAIAVNYRDILVRRGTHTVALPSGLGLESAGVIEAIGPQVSDLAIG
jgi:NADPH2:quinone reductase